MTKFNDVNHLCWSQKKTGHTLTLVSASVHTRSDALKTFNHLEDERAACGRSWTESSSDKTAVDFINISVTDQVRLWITSLLICFC